MKINYFQDNTLDENRVEVYFNEVDSEISGVMDYLNTYDSVLGKREEVTKKIFLGEIYYLEIVDRRCYVYLENEVFQVDYSLKSFQERFACNGFIQIGKSMLVNIYKIDYVKTDFNMKMQLIMNNKETLILNRAFKANFISFLSRIRSEKHENN